MAGSRYHRTVVFDASGSPPAPGAPSGEARRPLLGELLLQAKVVTAEQLAQALAAQTEPVNDKKIGQLLIERGWITEAQLIQTLSLQLSVPWVSLYHIDFSRQLLNRVERGLAEKYCLIPIFVRHVKGQGETLYVAMDDPTNEGALAEVARQASLPARPMIASATDIRSAIRVYYGEPTGAGQIIDVPAPPTRAEPPMTTREGQQRREVAPPTPPVPTIPDPPRQSQPGRVPSHPPPAPPAARKPPPPTPISHASHASDEGDVPPPTTRSNPPPGVRAASSLASPGENAAAPQEASASAPAAAPRAEGSEPRRVRGKMLSLTLLDGTTISLPAKKSAAAADGLTARDFVSALRATAHGADATEILGETPQWEPVVAALLSILLRKGLIADWEFIEELRKI
jgi:type IV pilus assembly protein PilB